MIKPVMSGTYRRNDDSIEAVGIDVFALIAAQGWEIYPIGSGAAPDCVPKGTLSGIIIVQ
jgi:hypothetical protein